MSPLANDIKRQARIAASLPSVADWIRAGGQVDRTPEPPRREAVVHAPKRAPVAGYRPLRRDPAREYEWQEMLDGRERYATGDHS